MNAARSTGTNYYEWGQQGAKAKTGDKNVKITLSAPGSIVGQDRHRGWRRTEARPCRSVVSRPARSSADGTFKLEDVSAGKHDLQLRGANFAEFIQRDVEVKPGKPTDVGTITVMRGRRVTGKRRRRVGHTGRGRARAKLGEMLFSMQGAEEQLENVQEMYGNMSATTDQDGTFVLVGIPKKATNVDGRAPDRGRSQAIAIAAGTDDPPPITLAAQAGSARSPAR